MSKGLPGYKRYSISYEKEKDKDVIQLLDNMGQLRTRIIRYMLQELIIKPYGTDMTNYKVISAITEYTNRAHEKGPANEQIIDSTVEAPCDQGVFSNNEISFEVPTLEEVKNYINENQLVVDADTFFYHYSANGWIQDRGVHIKNWQAQLLEWNAIIKKEMEEKESQ